MNQNIYRHSGKVGYSPFLLLLAGVPLLIVLSYIYAYVVIYNPFVYITFLVAVGYICAAGFTVALLAKAGKCRNRWFVMLSGLAGGLLALFFSWTFFLYALAHRFGAFQPGIFDLALNPSLMWQMIQELNYTGWFAFGKAVPSGIFLWIIWAFEALAIIGGMVYLSAFSIDEEMFCEKCSAWCSVKETRHLKITPELEQTKAAKINPAMLNTLETTDSSVTPYIKADLLECAGCASCKGWRYNVVTSKVDNKGNENVKLKPVPGIVMTQ